MPALHRPRHRTNPPSAGSGIKPSIHFPYVATFKDRDPYRCYARSRTEAEELAIKALKVRKNQLRQLSVKLADGNWNAL